uniref:ANK_REP_REGION domain-containing protein n=1 Tax=Macrostomum lignano TaxID=282301 RepID=A0A1I8IY30_9PLAT
MDSSLESLFLQMKKCIVECRSDILRVMLSTVESADQEKLQKLMQYTTNEGSLLHIACQQKMLDGIRILLNTGIDPRLLNESQKTALADANFHPDILAVFLQHCIQLISQANTEGLVRMLQIGISVNSLDRTDSQQNTLLHWACHFAQPACVRLLLERSANPNVANRDGVTPLHLCLIKADLELVRLLIQYGANPSVYVKQGPYADKNGFDLCSLSDKSVQLMQLISQQHHQQSQQQLYSQPTQMSAASSTSPSVANGSDSGATAAAASAVAAPADEARARPMNGTLVVAKPVQGVSLEIGHRVCRGRPEGYYLEVTSSGIRLLAADVRGLFNGAAVLSSLLTVCAEISMGLVPGIRVWDWPTTLVRGVLIDCSSGLLPRPEALISVAESAACMRANQLHLFFRLGSTAHACPYAQEDLRRVVRSAQELCLTPVLAIDIGIAVSDLTQVQSQADVLLGAFPPNCPMHLGPRLSAHLAQGPEQEAPVWLGLGRQHLYLASSGFSLPPWLQKLPITCIDHCLPRDRPEDRATYLHSALPEFVLAPATGAWLSFTGCHSLQRTRLCP